MMAAKKAARGAGEGGIPPAELADAGDAGDSIDHLIQAALLSPIGATGRYIISARPGEMKSATASIRSMAGISTISAADFEDGFIPAGEVTDEAIELPELGIYITSSMPEQSTLASLASDDTGIRDIVPETIKFLPIDGAGLPFIPQFAADGEFSPAFASSLVPSVPFATPMPFMAPMLGGRSFDYWQGYLAALMQLLYGQQLGPLPFAIAQPPVSMVPPGVFTDQLAGGGAALSSTPASTWGLQATRVNTSRLTGAGVRVAILDSGIDLRHPDFQDGRIVAAQSFVGEHVQDVPTPGNQFLNIPGNPGHGTHCAGTACGPRNPSGASVEGRYGVACEASILVGKVFKNNGTTVDGAIFEAMEWAIRQRADIISMSLTGPPHPLVDAQYARIAEEATRKGVAIIAAVGNDSNRPGLPGFRTDRRPGIAPVGAPANNKRVMGVAALNRNLQLAAFSNRGTFGTAEGVDIAAPGMEVYSSLPPTSSFAQGGRPYGQLQGTSMATPHVAGIAALVKQQNPGISAPELLRTVLRLARRLDLDSNDVGAGLAQAPQ